MKKILALTAIAAGLFAGNASATLFVIDDFSVVQGPVADNTPANGGTTSIIPQRTIVVDQSINAAPGVFNSSVNVVVGDLFISNDSSTNSVIDIAWTLAAETLPSISSAASFFLDVVASDGNATTLDFFFNASLLASFAIPANTVNQQLNFNLTTAQIALVSAGGVLDVQMTGADGWDARISTIGFNDTPPSPPSVPEPAALALMGLGLAGFAAARKKKQA